MSYLRINASTARMLPLIDRAGSMRLEPGSGSAGVTPGRDLEAARVWRFGEDRIRLLMETGHMLPWEAEADSLQFSFTGDQAEKMLGYPRTQWYEAGFWVDHIHPEDRAAAIAHRLKHTAISDQFEFEYRMRARDGRVVWVRDLVKVVREHGKPKTLVGFMIDITEQKETEITLRDISGRLINAQEEERRRVARELHDDLNQRMALLSMELEQLGQKVPARQAQVRNGIDELRLKAQEISTELHRMSYRLHPSKLDHLGLATALKGFCEELGARHGIEIDYRQFGFTSAIPPDVTLCVFRIAQESLRNVIKHSGSRSALVILERTATGIRLSVSDQGCGFEMGSGMTHQGLGFVSMSERLRLVGGEITVRSQPMQGTEITVTAPVPASLRKFKHKRST